MHILGTPLHAIDATFIEQLASERVPESITHDYKRALPHSREVKGKERLLESASAFANSAGGVLVFGVQASQRTGWVAGGLPDFNEDRDVLNLQNLLNSGLEPPLLRTEPSILRRDTAPPLLLLGIARSLRAPHRLSLNYGGQFYRRDDRGNQPMSVAELREAFAERERWQQEAEGVRAERIRLRLSNEINTPFLNPRKGPVGALFLHVLPLGRLRDHVSAGETTKWWRTHVQQHRGTVRLRGLASPVTIRPNLDGWLVSDSSASGVQYEQIFRHGGLEAGTTLHHYLLPGHDKPGGQLTIRGAELERLLSRWVVEALECMKALGVSPPYAVYLSLLAVDNLMLLGPESETSTNAGTMDRSDLLLPALVLEDSPGDVPRCLRDLFDALWQAASWDRSPCYTEAGEWLLSMG